jgi:hypothetical protein
MANIRCTTCGALQCVPCTALHCTALHAMHCSACPEPIPSRFPCQAMSSRVRSVA